MSRRALRNLSWEVPCPHQALGCDEEPSHLGWTSGGFNDQRVFNSRWVSVDLSLLLSFSEETGPVLRPWPRCPCSAPALPPRRFQDVKKHAAAPCLAQACSWSLKPETDKKTRHGSSSKASWDLACSGKCRCTKSGYTGSWASCLQVHEATMPKGDRRQQQVASAGDTVRCFCCYTASCPHLNS